MNRKLKNTLGLVGILIIIILLAGSYSFIYQKGRIKKGNAKLEELQKSGYNTEELVLRLEEVSNRASVLDSIISSRRFNIPKTLNQTHFYNFVNSVSYNFAPQTKLDIEYVDSRREKNFNHYIYKVSGTAEFNDVFKLIYAIEQSKELKKINSGSLATFVAVDSDGIPQYMVNFNFQVAVYFADDDRFTTSNFTENNLVPSQLHDIFYPLIRSELLPNSEGLLEVDNAKLLALIPDGAFIADAKGNTFMLWEGDEVYLGYLTKIDYKSSTVSFILNKGGIIEKVSLTLQKEENQKRKIK